MTRSQAELLDVLKAMLARLQAAEEKMDQTARRQVEIEAQLNADVSGAEPLADGDLVEALKMRIDELQLDVERARTEAARSGERFKEFLGELVFDDKAPRDDVGVPQYVRLAASGAGEAVVEPAAATSGAVALALAHPDPDPDPDGGDAPAPPRLAWIEAPDHDERAGGRGRRMVPALALVLAMLGAGFGAGVYYARRVADAPGAFVIPSSCADAASLATQATGLQRSVTTQYQRISSRALAGHRVTTEDLLPGDKAMASLAENNAAITAALGGCNADLAAVAARG